MRIWPSWPMRWRMILTPSASSSRAASRGVTPFFTPQDFDPSGRTIQNFPLRALSSTIGKLFASAAGTAFTAAAVLSAVAFFALVFDDSSTLVVEQAARTALTATATAISRKPYLTMNRPFRVAPNPRTHYRIAKKCSIHRQYCKAIDTSYDGALCRKKKKHSNTMNAAAVEN